MLKPPSVNDNEARCHTQVKVTWREASARDHVIHARAMPLLTSGSGYDLGTIVSSNEIPNVFVIKNNRFIDVHGAVVLDTFGSFVEYRMYVMISLYVHPRSTSFVFALWVFRFWFLWRFFEAYTCRRSSVSLFWVEPRFFVFFPEH